MENRYRNLNFLGGGKMKITNAQVLEILNGLRQIGNKELPVRTSVIVNRNFRNLFNEVGIIENERKKILSASVGTTPVDDAKRIEVDKKIAELLAVEIEVDLESIATDELGSITVTPVVIAMINPILK